VAPRRPRRRSVDRYANLREPQATLDFHGRGPLATVDVHAETIRFVKEARTRGLERVRIVTGRGVHSARGPVVRPQVERTLRRLQEEGLVARFQPERIDAGGDGAFRVDLAPPG
jgi:DNA-nicking Smr family endonuclease